MIDVLEVAAARSSRSPGPRSAVVMPRRRASRHRREDHRVAVAGDQLIGREVVEQRLEEREVLRRLGAIGSGLVVMPCEAAA